MAKHPYFSNKKAIIPIFFVSILWFLYGAGDGNQNQGSIATIEPQICFANSPRAQYAHTISQSLSLAPKKTPRTAWGFFLEQVTGIEPAYSAWEADTLPLSYTCLVLYNYNTKRLCCQV